MLQAGSHFSSTNLLTEQKKKKKQKLEPAKIKFSPSLETTIRFQIAVHFRLLRHHLIPDTALLESFAIDVHVCVQLDSFSFAIQFLSSPFFSKLGRSSYHPFHFHGKFFYYVQIARLLCEKLNEGPPEFYDAASSKNADSVSKSLNWAMCIVNAATMVITLNEGKKRNGKIFLISRKFCRSFYRGRKEGINSLQISGNENLFYKIYIYNNLRKISGE